MGGRVGSIISGGFFANSFQDYLSSVNIMSIEAALNWDEYEYLFVKPRAYLAYIAYYAQ